MKIYGPAALLVLAAFVLAYQFIKPAPPDTVVMATGGVDGAYHGFNPLRAAPRARRHHAGAAAECRFVENIRLLREIMRCPWPWSRVASTTAGRTTGLQSLGSVYYEPLWLFHRRDRHQRPARSRRARVAVGPWDRVRGRWYPGYSGTMGDGFRAMDPAGGEDAVDAMTEGRGRGIFVIPHRAR